ncbi:hypothetical protein [Halobacterium hubeiense]|uniref:hypothetical protein n=1 Tax=Halobacterium hubeiense TaxID=1407499 RepID=UPI003C78AB6B
MADEKQDHRDRPARESDATDDGDTATIGTAVEPDGVNATSTSDEQAVDEIPPDEGGETEGDDGGGEPPNLAAPDLHLLTFLWLIERNDTTFDVTGFQAKRLYEQTGDGKHNIGQRYADLKGPFIQDHRDTEPVQLTSEGREVVKEADDIQTAVRNELAETIRDLVDEEPILRRSLWLAHANVDDYEWYLDVSHTEVAEPERFFSLFFTDEQLQATPTIGAAIDDIGNLTAQLQSDLNTKLDTDDYLKALATLSPEAVTGILQIDTDETIRCNATQETLGYYIGESEAQSVLDDLRRIGLDSNHNSFKLDLDTLLENHRAELSQWLTFDSDACRSAFENHWDLILEWNSGFPGRTDSMIQKLVEVGAVVPQNGYLAVRSDVANIANQVLTELRAEVHNRLDGIANVGFQLFYDFEEVMEHEEDVIITLHENSSSSNQYHYPAFIKGSSSSRSDPEKNPFTTKTILVPSPKEFGFTDDHLQRDRYHCHGTAIESPPTNQEFNALGTINGLTAVKDAFDTVGWEQASNRSVDKAEEIITEREKISVDSAFDELSEYDEIYQEALYTVAAKRTTKTSIKRNNYTAELLWDDLHETLEIRDPSLSESEINDIETTLRSILTDRAGINIVEYRDEEQVYERFGEQLDQIIKTRIRNLSPDERRLVHTFLTGWGEEGRIRPDWHLNPKFHVYHEFWFDESAEINTLLEVLVRTGICSLGTYIDSSGDSQGHRYAVYHGVQENPEKFLDATSVSPDTASIDVFDGYESSIPQLAGLEYLLDNNGEASRTDLRDELLSIDQDAWMTFEMLDGAITEREDTVYLNPLLVTDAARWLTEQKRRQVTDVDGIERRLSQADVIDLQLSFGDKRRVYHGQLLTPDNEEIQIIVSPWLTEKQAEWIDHTAIVIITSPYSDKVISRQRSTYGEYLVLGITEDEFEVYRSLPYEKITNPIIEAFEDDYTLIDHHVDLDAENPSTNPNPQQSTVDETETTTTSDTSETDTTAAPAVATAGAPSESPTDEVDLVGELLTQQEGAFPADVLRDRPLIILLHKPANDRYGTTVQFLCRELYHHLEGGLPRSQIRGDADDVERHLKASNRIEFIDETDAEFFKHTRSPTNSVTNNQVQWKAIRRRIQELDTQGLGFLIFQLPTDFVDTFKSELVQRVRPHRPQVIELDPPLHRDEYADLDAYLDRAVPTAKALWGFPDLSGDFTFPAEDEPTFDDLFTLAEHRAWTHLHRGTSKPIESDTESRSPVMAVRPNQPGDSGQNNESILHYALKTFVVRWLIESEGHDFASVTTETDTPLAQQTNKQLIPDIQRHSTVFEIETLYGTGIPLLGLKETIEKYHRHGKSPDICLVLPPLAGFLYYSEITRLTHEIDEQWDLVVTPLIPNLQSTKLVPLSHLKHAIQQGSQFST